MNEILSTLCVIILILAAVKVAKPYFIKEKEYGKKR